VRDSLAKFGGVVALVLAALWVDGCKQRVAPVALQPVIRSTPRPIGPMLSDFPPNDASVPDANAVASRQPRIRRVAAPQVVPTPTVDVQAVEEAQRRRDGELLKQQESASQRQQQELNGVVQQSLKIQQEQQAEPRIQDAPEPPPWLFSQPTQLGQDEPRIQDAPGPAQINQVPAPTEPQGSPQL
jgi:hypothetical protein